MEIVYGVFKRLIKRKNKGYMNPVCAALDKLIQEGKQTININGITKLFADAEIIVKSEMLVLALQQADLPRTKFMRLETFVAWMIVVLSKNPLFFELGARDQPSRSPYIISNFHVEAIPSEGKNWNYIGRRRRGVGRRRRLSNAKC